MEKLRIAGAWIGVLEVQLEQWTVPMLRDELAKRSNSEPDSIKLICAGRILKESDKNPSLAEIGVKNNDKVLVSRTEVDKGQSLGKQLQAEEKRSATLASLKKAVADFAKGYTDGSLPGLHTDYSLGFVNQSGQRFVLGSKTDQSNAMMGLLFDARAKQLIREQSYRDALEVLAMGEEAFSLCDPKIVETISTAHGLQIDIVWCFFMLRDISKLSNAGARLAKARKGIQSKPVSSVIQLALHLRLELLEGVVAYHHGEIDKSRELLISAQEKLSKLDVETRKRKRRDQEKEAISSELVSMGFERSKVILATNACRTKEEALIKLLLPYPVKLQDEDIDVTKEAEAINKYLALLKSSSSSR